MEIIYSCNPSQPTRRTRPFLGALYDLDQPPQEETKTDSPEEKMAPLSLACVQLASSEFRSLMAYSPNAFPRTAVAVHLPSILELMSRS